MLGTNSYGHPEPEGDLYARQHNKSTGLTRTAYVTEREGRFYVRFYVNRSPAPCEVWNTSQKDYALTESQRFVSRVG